jgi:hypothetical protein
VADVSLSFNAKVARTVAYVAYGAEYRSKASGKLVEARCQELCSREAGQCETRHTPCACRAC